MLRVGKLPRFANNERAALRFVIFEAWESVLLKAGDFSQNDPES